MVCVFDGPSRLNSVRGGLTPICAAACPAVRISTAAAAISAGTTTPAVRAGRLRRVFLRLSSMSRSRA